MHVVDILDAAKSAHHRLSQKLQQSLDEIKRLNIEKELLLSRINELEEKLKEAKKTKTTRRRTTRAKKDDSSS